MKNTPKNFIAGKTQYCVEAWKTFTTDKTIIACLQGSKIDFEYNVDQKKKPKPLQFDQNETRLIDNAINRMIDTGIVEPCSPTSDQFLSQIFPRLKPDGTVRVILNLKQLNESVKYHHFKMETLESVLDLVTPGCFMACVDLKDAYYSIPVHRDHRKYLRFEWFGELLQFTALPNGLAEAPRKYTKIAKTAFAYLRKNGYPSASYLDDSWLKGETFLECLQNVKITVWHLDRLGFTIHPDKTVFIPSQILEFLGCVINSLAMIVELTLRKKNKIVVLCTSLIEQHACTIRELAQVIGNLVAAEPAVEMAPVFYRRLEIYKGQKLAEACGDFDVTIQIPDFLKEDLNWWIDNIHTQMRRIEKPNPDFEITTDASDFAWGAHCEGKTVGGPWGLEEKLWHINFKELVAVWLALKVFAANKRNVSIKIAVDNMTALSYVHRKGGRKEYLNEVARCIWLWLIERKIDIQISFIPGKDNKLADSASRTDYHDSTEWKLNPVIFKKLVKRFGECNIDLFASRLNYQCKPFCAWGLDPEAEYVDAFTFPWTFTRIYVFPPFSVLGKVLKKIQRDQCQAIVVAPLWPTQPWFTTLLEMVIDYPVLLPLKDNLLLNPIHKGRKHPMGKRLKLAVFNISPNSSKQKEFRKQLQSLCLLPGETQQEPNMGLTNQDMMSFVSKGVLIKIKRLYCRL